MRVVGADRLSLSRSWFLDSPEAWHMMLDCSRYVCGLLVCSDTNA